MKTAIDLFNKPTNFPEVSYSDKLLLLGSCFSGSIGEKLKFAGFHTEVNPLGVVFHPLALAQQIRKTIQNDTSGTVFTNHDVHLHSLASSEVYGLSKELLLEKYSNQQQLLANSLKTSKVLYVTFGSMHGYWLNDTLEIVANCHKQPAFQFSKKCSEIAEVVDVWKELLNEIKVYNPELTVVFTVSPVRYTRDGILENNLSKSRLVEVLNQLDQHYLPSYELINDVLRDFSFFENDKSHPNQRAVDEVWNMFQLWSFSDETKTALQHVMEIRSRESHRLMFPDSVVSKEFVRVTNEKREQLRSLFPSIVL